MLINEKRKFIFVHIQKTAGTSIERLILRNYPETMQWHGRHGHAIDGIKDIGADAWAEYFSFAFIRNPWDRLVSWYTMIKEQERRLSKARRASKEPFDSSFWNHAVADSHDFESFLTNCTDVVFEKGCAKSYAFSQLDYLTDMNGSLAVDFVGRFENFSADLSAVLVRLGIKDTVGKLNTSRHSHYSDYYNRHTRELVARRFTKDIELFGYQFLEPERMN